MQLKNFLKAVLKIYEDIGDFKFSTFKHFLLLLLIFVVAMVVVNLKESGLFILSFPYILICFAWTIQLFDKFFNKKLPKGIEEGIVGTVISFLGLMFVIFSPIIIGALFLGLPSILLNYFF